MRALMLSCLVLAGLIGGARAGVVISAKPTHAMSCSGGVCMPTGKNAVLNVEDLAALLAGSDVTVTGKDIALDAALSWTSAHVLSLDAERDVVFAKPLIVAGTGGLAIAAAGELRFTGRGHVEMWDAADMLSIDGNRYVLVSSFRALQKAMARQDFVALAKSFHAPKKTFSASPIASFAGTLEGLGNTISGLSVDDETGHAPVGLIGALDGTARDIGLTDADMRGGGAEKITGALVGQNFGNLIGVSASGRVFASGGASYAGGLAGRNDGGTIIGSHADTAVTASGSDFVEGGLVGLSTGSVERCYATGAVMGADASVVGGLMGINGGGAVSNSYATGAVAGGDGTELGGLIGSNGGEGAPTATVTSSYSTGAVVPGTNAIAGGLLGGDSGTASHTYWDLDTSGISDPSQGAGTVPNDPGVTGVTTAQLQAGLLAGFDKKIWAEKPGINGGLPYLR